ncbi:MAG: cardiolipin synthase [Lachnospiraceae bacterium]|nr:cardiolipin synthase [Lachnospiraceae bacterium]
MKKQKNVKSCLGYENDRNMREKGRIKNCFSGLLRACVVTIFVALQFVFLLLLSILLQQYTVYFYVLVEFCGLLIILFLVNDEQRPAYKIAWITICLLLPITGELMFCWWGNKTVRKKMTEKFQECRQHSEAYMVYNSGVQNDFARLDPMGKRMIFYLEQEGFPLTKNNTVQYFSTGEDLFESLFCDLKRAKKFIFLDFFTVAEGALWDQMYKICLKKIQEGVEIYFLYDDLGSMLRLGRNFKKNLTEQGFHVAVFNPVHKYMDFNDRSHQKLVVIDGNIAYTGGVNIADEYANLVERFGRWKDNGIRLEGDSVWWMTVAFLQMWELTKEADHIDYKRYRSTKKFKETDVFCQVMVDGPVNNPNHPIATIYGQLIHYAQKYLYIMTPYLILEKDMQDALVTAAKSGVDVRIITPYIPDKKSVKLVTYFYYGYLLKHGVRIFEYLPGFIHSKVILNESLGIVGSINMDYRSFYLHFENGVLISGEEVLSEIQEDFTNTFLQSKEITYTEWKQRPLLVKCAENVLNLFATML